MIQVNVTILYEMGLEDVESHLHQLTIQQYII